MDKISQEDYLILVGKLVQGAAIADLYLFSAFYRLSKTDLDIARKIYFAIDSLNFRTNIVRALADMRDDTEIRKLVDEIAKAVQVAQSQRNRLAHALLGKTELTNQDLVKINPRQNTTEPITSGFLKSLSTESFDAVLRAKEQWEILAKKLEVPPETAL